MIQSINFRLGDSMPASVIEKWKNELDLLPGNSRLEADAPKICRQDAGAPGKRVVKLRRRIEEYLDAGHGNCWLRRPDIARLVERALFHFDGQRYRLLAWCIMPNHVHAMIETCEGFKLADIVHSWKSFTANQANQLLKRRGEFWQREYLDRYIRNVEHYEQAITYIEENPVKAGLARVKTDWPWNSARFRSAGDVLAGSAGFQPAS
jgi:REP element-mobilizing transposase RayT